MAENYVSMVTVKKKIFDSMNKTQSEHMFEVLTYINLFKNCDCRFHISISGICDYFQLQKTNRNISDIKESIDLLISLDIIYVAEEITNLNKFILGEVLIDSDVYRSIELSKVETLCDNVLNHSEKFKIGMIYYLILCEMTYNSSANTYHENSLSYEFIMSKCNIGNRNTAKRYLNFLIDNGHIQAIKKFNEKNGNTFIMYKII